MIVDFNTCVGNSLNKMRYKTQRVGLELEYEHTKQGMPVIDNMWHTEIDHSLRAGGMEYISVPLLEKEIEEAVFLMVESAKSENSKVTPRCGLHVHVNASYMKWRELYNFCTYYTLLEPALFATFAPGREQSHFCVPTWMNTALAEFMYQDGQKLRDGIKIPKAVAGEWKKASLHLGVAAGGMPTTSYGALRMLRTPKYAALNISSLKKFGTLEFRQAPSSLSPKFIIDWATVLLRIQRAACEYNKPEDILTQYDKDGLLTLCEDVYFKPKSGVEDLDQEDAVDTATIIAGHVPVNWMDLSWTVKGA